MIHQATSEIRWHQNRDKTETDKYSVPFSKLYVGGGGGGEHQSKETTFPPKKKGKKKGTISSSIFICDHG